MKSLRCVLAATVKGARGSRVPLIPGSMAPRRTDVTDATAHHIFIRQRVRAPGPMTTNGLVLEDRQRHPTSRHRLLAHPAGGTVYA